MKRYIGTKVIQARPMDRRTYNVYRGWQLPENENGSDEGYLVEYMDGGTPNDARHIGYISWSPKAQFEGAYRETSGLTFGLALEALKMGHKVARSGWNGKGMWIALSPGSPALPCSSFWSRPAAEWAFSQEGHSAEVLPCIIMKTINAHGREAILMGWLASQTDMLSEDWAIV